MTELPRLSRRSLLVSAGVAGIAAATPGLAGCGASGDPAGGAHGDRLTLGTTQIMQFDPYQTNSALHIHSFYSYLIDYAPGGYRTVPAGAEKWAIGSDFRSVTITLRAAKFHDGRAIGAEDVVAGVKRALDPKDGFTLVQPSEFIKKATAVDKRTVRIDFHYAVAEGIVLDWMFSFPLVPADHNSGAALANKPAGSGPFRLVDYDPNRRLRLSRNPHYWDKGKPRLKEIEFRFFQDDQAMVSALQSGDVDGATYLEFNDVAQLKDQFTVAQGSGRMDIFFMNGGMPPFDNVKLRQALARAIDREKIIKQVRFGIGDPVYAPIMPGSAGFDKSYLTSHAFDLDAAARLLKKAGGERTATAAVSSDPGASQMMQIIQDDFKKIGFDLTLKPMEATAFLNDLFAGKLQCCVANQPNTLQSPGLVARGRAMLPSQDNVMMKNQVPQSYIDAVHACNTATTTAAQRDAYAQLNKVIVDGAWAVGIATKKSLAGLRRQISGYAVDQRDYLILDNLRTH